MELTLPKGKYIATFSKRIDEFTSDGRIFPYIYNSGNMYSGSKPNASSSSGFSFTYAFELWQETTVKAGIFAELAWSTNSSYGLFQAIRIG